MTLTAPLGEQDLERLQHGLDTLPAPLEPLDVTMLDGYLCAVLLQPRRLPEADWLPHVFDVDGRRPPPKLDLAPLRDLVRRRHAELDQAIESRQWFDPWVYELDEDASPSETVLPWVAGFATACALFPALMEVDTPGMLEPLATLYMHLDPDDLEDADALIAEIETLEPPADLPEAVEGLVRSCLLIADETRPLKTARSQARSSVRAGPARRGSGPTGPARKTGRSGGPRGGGGRQA